MGGHGQPTLLEYLYVGGALTAGEFGSRLVAIFLPQSKAAFEWKGWTRLHGRRAAQLLEAGHPASAQSSMAKLAVAELMQRVAAFAVDLLGPEGLLEEGIGTLPGRAAAFQRASVATTISGGAAEIQRTVIARRELGFPGR